MSLEKRGGLEKIRDNRMWMFHKCMSSKGKEENRLGCVQLCSDDTNCIEWSINLSKKCAGSCSLSGKTSPHSYCTYIYILKLKWWKNIMLKYCSNSIIPPGERTSGNKSTQITNHHSCDCCDKWCNQIILHVITPLFHWLICKSDDPTSVI